PRRGRQDLGADRERRPRPGGRPGGTGGPGRAGPRPRAPARGDGAGRQGERPVLGRHGGRRQGAAEGAPPPVGGIPEEVNMIRISQLRAELIRPACRLVGWHSPAAEDLLVGTFLAESLVDGDTCLRQLGGGPARGIFQMEPATHDDIWRNWLGYRPEGERVRALTPAGHGFPRAENLVFNLLYAAAIARAHYRR